MANLPLFKNDDQVLQLMQTRWKSQLDPLLTLPILSGNQLEDVLLANGVTVINHRLGRDLQGWFITDVNGAATIYRSAITNDKTLTLTSNAAVTVSLWVF